MRGCLLSILCDDGRILSDSTEITSSGTPITITVLDSSPRSIQHVLLTSVMNALAIPKI
jgi:hypothetical protein